MGKAKGHQAPHSKARGSDPMNLPRDLSGEELSKLLGNMVTRYQDRQEAI